MNIRARLTILFVLLVGSIMLLFSVSVYYLYDQFRQQEFAQRLEEKAVTTMRLREDVGKVPQADLPVMPNEQVTIYNDRGRVLYDQGRRRLRLPVSPALFRQIATRKSSLYFRQGDLEIVGLPFLTPRGESLVGVVSAYDRYGFSKLARLREILLFGWLLCLIIVGLAGYWFSTDALRPVAELITQVNAISATTIHERLRVGRQRDELADLARTFNALLNRLEEAFVSQKSFVSHASHELRTPLTVMLGQIEVTRLQSRSPAEYETAIDALLDEVKGMIRLVNGLLELARVNAGAVPLHYQPVRIDELLWQAQSQIAHTKPAYTVHIDFETLPDQEEDMIVAGEESLLQTAFQNLMENGCKYSPDGRVGVRMAFEPGWVQLTVSDRGHGIPAADLPHIFEPFYRSENAMPAHGHGIGLALTARIVDLHRGRIAVESVLGEGTVFRVMLPTGDRRPAQLPAPDARTHRAPATGSGVS